MVWWMIERPRVPGTVLDVAWAVGAVAFGCVALAAEFGEGDVSGDPFSYVVVVLAGAALAVRRTQPMAVLLVAAIARVVVAGAAGSEIALYPAVALAIYTVVRTGRRRVDLPVAVALGVVTAIVIAAMEQDTFLLELLGELALVMLPVAVADALSTREDRLADLIDTEADRRVQAERLRIARDLHDIVAHGLSTISVQSGVASHLLDRDPDLARDALDVINATGKASLEELRSMLGVLRSTDGPLRPTPTDPNDFGDVLAAAAHGGVEPETVVTGSFPVDVGSSSVVAAHRIIQEALTNVARHAGSVPTTLRVEHGADAARIEVTNEASAVHRPAVGSTGVGIVGMTERAESVGGTLTAGPTEGGGFRVTAVVPYGRRSP